MPICSNCNQEYDELEVIVTEENRYRIFKDESEDGFDWSSEGLIEATEKEAIFICPFCKHQVGYWSDEDMAVTGSLSDAAYSQLYPEE